MTLFDTSTPLADKALSRLRMLAKGNGLEPEKIVLSVVEEKTHTFEGKMTLMPLFESKEQRYFGPPRGDCRKFPTPEFLHAEAKRREAEFKGNPSWIQETIRELRLNPGEGWGLDNARIELPRRSVTLAASEMCQTCHGGKNISCTRCYGRGFDICIQCHGQKQEFCFGCSGTGHNPQVPDQMCLICHGNRFVFCRLCHGTGQTGCPICHARGKTPCAACQGTGEITEEIRITCGAQTHFVFKAEDMPSGLRRGLDRIGIVNLPKGHAEIHFVEAEAEIDDYDEDKIYKNLPGGLIGVAPPLSGMPAPPLKKDDEDSGFGSLSKPKKKSLIEPVIYYKGSMPYADLRVDFGGKRKAAIGVFGLRGVFLDVPPFLDDFLNPAIEKLKEATKGRGAINAAFEIRALREALELNLVTKGSIKELRRIYPLGVSNEVLDNVLFRTRLSISRLTLQIRMIAAGGSAILSAGIFAIFFLSSLHAQLPLTWEGEIAYRFLPLILAWIIAGLTLNFAAYFDLQRHFPSTKIGLWHAIGAMGYGTMAAIVVIWFGMLAASPLRPPSLASLVH